MGMGCFLGFIRSNILLFCFFFNFDRSFSVLSELRLNILLWSIRFSLIQPCTSSPLYNLVVDHFVYLDTCIGLARCMRGHIVSLDHLMIFE